MTRQEKSNGIMELYFLDWVVEVIIFTAEVMYLEFSFFRY